MNFQERSDKLLAAMVKSDRLAASALIDQAHAEGVTSLDIIAHILDPSLESLPNSGLRLVPSLL